MLVAGERRTIQGVACSRFESMLGWSPLVPVGTRITYLAMSRRRAELPDDTWWSPTLAMGLAVRDGLESVESYLAGRIEYPAASVRRIGWMLAGGRSLSGSELVVDARSMVRMCELAMLLHAAREMVTRS